MVTGDHMSGRCWRGYHFLRYAESMIFMSQELILRFLVQNSDDLYDLSLSLSLVEKRLYPSSSFWKTLLGRKKELTRVTATSNSPGGIILHPLNLHLFNNLVIECGEIDGVVLGSWTNINESPSETMVDEDNAHAGYWAAAAVWSNAWDQRTIDRVSHCSYFSLSYHFKKCFSLCPTLLYSL